MLTDKQQKKLARLRQIIRNLGSLAVAFSGGADSSLLARVAHDELGDQAIAITAWGKLQPGSELEEARRIADSIGIRHIVVETNQLEREEFVRNAPARCYYCKKEMLVRLAQAAGEANIRHIAEGSNVDDTDMYRPGRRAVSELGVKCPLIEAGLAKEDVRAISKELGLTTWDKPASACLASRIAYGEPITSARLKMIEKAEAYLRRLRLRQVRVRYHAGIARIEVAPADIARLAGPELREELVGKLKELGFNYVTLDLEGYRSGSMDETLPS